METPTAMLMETPMATLMVIAAAEIEAAAETEKLVAKAGGNYICRDRIRLGLITKTSPKSRLDPEGTSLGRTRGYPDLDSHVPSQGTRHFWGGYKLLFLAGTLILRKIICTYVGYICT